jgi:hypothetical protein
MKIITIYTLTDNPLQERHITMDESLHVISEELTHITD